MTLEQIKAAVESGKSVYYKSLSYQVKKSKSGRFDIVCEFNDFRMGLTWSNGRTVNGKPEDFFCLPSILGRCDCPCQEKEPTPDLSHVTKQVSLFRLFGEGL